MFEIFKNMSLTFTLTARTSELSSYFYPPIKLDPKYEYAVALVGFYTYNTIPNVDEGVSNKFHYSTGQHNDILTIPTGSYEITDIEKYIQNKLLSVAPATVNIDDAREKLLYLKANNNTLKCEIKSMYDIDFTPNDSIGSILGYSKRKLPANQLHESDLAVEIIKVSTIRIECNIIKGSHYNSQSSHTLYEFAPTADPGYNISIEPKNLIFLPVNTTTIDNITLRVLDQNSNLVNFRGEEIIVRLELKKYGAGF